MFFSQPRLIHFFKIHKDHEPSYLKKCLPPTNRPCSRNNNHCKYHEIHYRNERYGNSFFPNSTSSWNNLGSDFGGTSVSVFKDRIYTLIRPQPKSIFGIHDPIGLKHLFHLRLGLSKLKSHKKHHNFRDTPNDWCLCHCAPEDTQHFLLQCIFFATPRAILIDSVQKILTPYDLQHLTNNVDLYLYGHSSLSHNENRSLILATIKFLKDSLRFQ